jgi:hypothetical protein
MDSSGGLKKKKKTIKISPEYHTCGAAIEVPLREPYGRKKKHRSDKNISIRTIIKVMTSHITSIIHWEIC